MMLDIAALRVTISHPDSGHEAPILHGIDLSVERGEAVGLVGESGSGKSMTLRAILGLVPDGAAVDGRITLDGEDLRSMSHAELQRVRARRLALIAQNPVGALNPVLPVGRFLVEGIVDAQQRPRDTARQEAVALLRRVGVRDPDRVLGAYPHQLSGGLLQRVVIAGAVSGSPQLLLADEPTTALDVTTQAEVAAILDEKRREAGMSMLFVTHDLDLAAAVCDRLVVMRDGEIVDAGSPAHLRDRSQHPYTRMLMEARPQLYPADRDGER